MSLEAASAACPRSAPGLVSMPTPRTPARCSSFQAGEARNVSRCGFVGQIVDITTIFPQAHALVVMSSIVMMANAMRIADEERTHPLLDAKVDHLAGGFVPQVSDTPFRPATLLVLCPLQLLPAARILLAASLFAGDLAQVFAALPFERPDATSGHDHRLARVGGDRRQVDLTEIGCCLCVARCLFRLWDLDTDVELKTIVPDQATRPALFWQVNRQDQGGTPAPHWQHHISQLFGDGLGGPFDGREAFGAPGILHAHLWMFCPQLARGLNGGKERGNHHLNRLTVQGELPPFASFCRASRPGQG